MYHGTYYKAAGGGNEAGYQRVVELRVFVVIATDRTSGGPRSSITTPRTATTSGSATNSWRSLGTEDDRLVIKAVR
jgi:hypothetical protein